MRAHLEMNVYFFAHIWVGICLLCVCWPASLRVCEFFVLLWRGVRACSKNPEALILRVCVCVCVRESVPSHAHLAQEDRQRP